MPAQSRQAKPVKELSAHLAPKPLAVRDFWRKWIACCQRNFPDASADIECIERLKINIDADPMFVHLNEGLEYLVLSKRSSEDVHLTAPAWLALTLVTLTAFASEHTRKNSTPARMEETRKAAIAALEQARLMFILSRGEAIEGMSMQSWIDKGPWNGNAPLWLLLFQHGLHLVQPEREPLYCALRQYWLDLQRIAPAIAADIAAMEFPPDMAAWGLPRPMELSSVQGVLRSGRRWALRAQNSMQDAILACQPAPQWTGVYMFSIWLHRMDNSAAVSPEELALLGACMVPSDMAYWLVLAHDCAHHKRQHRAVLNALSCFELEEDDCYAEASNILLGLQMFNEVPEIALAVAAWSRWKEIQEQDCVALPDLS